MTYAVEIGSGAVIYIPSFIKTGSGIQRLLLVTVAERSKASTAFARSEAGIVGSNLTQGVDVWYVYVIVSPCV
jgi:hypothetical protein